MLVRFGFRASIHKNILVLKIKREFMIIIKVLDGDLFEKYPEGIIWGNYTGLDGLSMVYIIINVTNILVLTVVNVVRMLLTYIDSTNKD